MVSHAGTLNVVERSATKSFGVAWLLLCAALAIHVADEALTDFLAVYNPTVLSIRSRLPFLPIPTFSFDTWLTGLILGIALLLGLAPFAFSRARLMVPLAYLFGIFMMINGLAHIGGSIYFTRLLPGVYSAPLLLAGALYLLDNVRQYRRRPA